MQPVGRQYGCICSPQLWTVGVTCRAAVFLPGLLTVTWNCTWDKPSPPVLLFWDGIDCNNRDGAKRSVFILCLLIELSHLDSCLLKNRKSPGSQGLPALSCNSFRILSLYFWLLVSALNYHCLCAVPKHLLGLILEQIIVFLCGREMSRCRVNTQFWLDWSGALWPCIDCSIHWQLRPAMSSLWPRQIWPSLCVGFHLLKLEIKKELNVHRRRIVCWLEGPYGCSFFIFLKLLEFSSLLACNDGSTRVHSVVRYMDARITQKGFQWHLPYIISKQLYWLISRSIIEMHNGDYHKQRVSYAEFSTSSWHLFIIWQL